MRFLIADDFHPSIFSMLDEKGWGYEYAPDISREELRADLDGFDGLLIRSKTRVDADLLADRVTIRVVGRCGSGMDNIDVNYLESRGIKAINAPEGNRNSVGDHTVGLILSLTKNIVRSDREVRSSKWLREENRGVELNSLTVGIIGFGNTGSAVAERLAAFGCGIITYDKHKKGMSNGSAEQVSMTEIFQRADILTLHIPLDQHTRHLVNESYLSSFSKPIYLVNTSRGEILDTKALVKGLQKGQILGAALDVLENEKVDMLSGEEAETFKFLQNSPNVILTPHIAGWSRESHILLNRVLVDKIAEWNH